jgi:tRNA U34 5-methylaminomethyl-2-thiouridine-forming methyltransferase MnmC
LSLDPCLGMYIITTKDGSHSLFSEQFNEIYHSRNGAIQESKHVFIRSGFDYVIRAFSSYGAIRIFEVGFGTGLNALLTLIEAEKLAVQVYYETIECFPVSAQLVNELNYTQLLDGEKYGPKFQSLHKAEWNRVHVISPNFTFKKNLANFPDFALPPNSFRIIYFDAFAPESQPEMWTLDIVQKAYDVLVPEGVMVTYCSKSIFRKTLIEAGFMVEKLPGPPGKREMIRAVKK